MSADQPTAHGPYNTGEQAYADIAATYGRTDRAWRYDMLTAACSQARAVLGEFDRQVLDSLAGRAPEITQVIVGLIERAQAAKDEALRLEIDALKAQIDSLEAKVRDEEWPS